MCRIWLHVDDAGTCSGLGHEKNCEVNTHLGIEQSRRDDLEAVGYVPCRGKRGP